MSQAEYITDGADYLQDNDIEEIVEDRHRRRHELVGKYVVVTDSRYQSDCILYLQDRKYGYSNWTKFLSNAKGYKTKEDAQSVANKFKYNNPRVLKVRNMR